MVLIGNIKGQGNPANIHVPGLFFFGGINNGNSCVRVYTCWSGSTPSYYMVVLEMEMEGLSIIILLIRFADMDSYRGLGTWFLPV